MSQPAPVRDWERVAPLFMSPHAEYGDLVTFEELRAQLEVHDEELGRLYRAVERAGRWLLEHHQRGIWNEPGLGYKVLRPDEYAAAMEKRRERGRRQLLKGGRLGQYAPYSLMTSQQAAATREKTNALVILAQMVGDHERRIRRIERLLALDLVNETGTVEEVAAEEPPGE
jgi:hypothetical protein